MIFSVFFENIEDRSRGSRARCAEPLLLRVPASSQTELAVANVSVDTFQTRSFLLEICFSWTLMDFQHFLKKSEESFSDLPIRPNSDWNSRNFFWSSTQADWSRRGRETSMLLISTLLPPPAWRGTKRQKSLSLHLPLQVVHISTTNMVAPKEHNHFRSKCAVWPF